MTHTTNDAPVTVEQCDRERAWPFRGDCYKHSDFAAWMEGAYDQHRAILAFARHRLAALASAPAEQHPDDTAVDRFAEAMKAKLAKARDKGRGGWDDPSQCTVEHLRDLLRGHVAKGDPVDVANFCMMLFHRGGSTFATCRLCDGTGYLDHAGYSMDPCGCSRIETAIASAEQEARRHGADSFGGKDFSSAPAGDGVPKVRDEGPLPEARVSLITRAVRQSLRDYGHRVAESSLPECIASDVEATLRTMRDDHPALARSRAAVASDE